MLSKVNSSNFYLGTPAILNYKDSYDHIQDNLNGYLLIKNNNNIFMLNYKKKKMYKYNKIQIEFNHLNFIKQIDSFDQNNILIANKIRMCVLLYCKINNINTVVGIGGEYYIYFPFINAKKYIGISNHKSIIEDAQNICSENYLVDYNSNDYPLILIADIIILNVFNIHHKIIEYIKKIQFRRLIIISCNLSDYKLDLLVKNFKILKIKYFKNFNKWIRVIIIY
jgi:hypothetical protein